VSLRFARWLIFCREFETDPANADCRIEMRATLELCREAVYDMAHEGDNEGLYAASDNDDDDYRYPSNAALASVASIVAFRPHLFPCLIDHLGFAPRPERSWREPRVAYAARAKRIQLRLTQALRQHFEPLAVGLPDGAGRGILDWLDQYYPK
jgi:hypothetical protein